MQASAFPLHLLALGILLLTFHQTITQINGASLKCGVESSKPKTIDAIEATTTTTTDHPDTPVAAVQATADTETITTAAPISSTTTETTEVQKLLHTVQCTLEKARPWMEEIEKEAKRLEQTAKRFGEGVIHRLSGIFEKLFTNEEHGSSVGPTLLLAGAEGAEEGSGNSEVAAVGNAVPAASTSAPAATVPTPDEADTKTPCSNAATSDPSPLLEAEADDVSLNEIASHHLTN